MSNDETSAGVPLAGGVLDTHSRLEALARLSDGLGTRHPFLLVTGEAGTGKTSVVHDVIARWGSRAVVARVTGGEMTGTEFLERIVRGFGLEPPPEAGTPQLLDRLERHVAEAEGNGQVPVIAIDDAHEISDDLLDDLRLLANVSALKHRPLEIILVGLPALEERLAQPALEPVRQRIAVRCRMNPFSQQETGRYLREVVSAKTPEGPGFVPRKTCREIFQQTGGVPRSIQALAAEAVSRARASGASVVTIAHVASAAVALGIATKRPAVETHQGATTDTRAGGTPATPANAGPATPANPSPAKPASTGTPTLHGAAARKTPTAPEPEAMPQGAVARKTPAAPEPATPQGAVARKAAASPEPAAASQGAIPRKTAAPLEPAATRKTAAPEPAATRKTAAPEPAATSTHLPDKAADAPSIAEPTIEGAVTAPPAFEPVADAPRPDPDDPRVRDWIERFIKPDEPRFGELLGSSPEAHASIPWEPEADAGEPSEYGTSEADADIPSVSRGARPGRRRRAAPPARRGGAHRNRQGWRTSSRRPRPGRTIVAGVALVGLIATAVLIVMPRGRASAPRTVAAASSPTAQRAAQPPIRSAPKRSSKASSKASLEPSSAAPPPRRTVPAPAPAPRERFGLDVGTYSDSYWAEDERDRIAAATGLKVWVVPDSLDGGDTYHVVIGVYRTRERAQSASQSLTDRGVVSQASVVPVPPKHLRR